MKITVSESLRLKNELKQQINTVQYETRNSPLGLNYENGVLTSDEENGNKFKQNISRLEKLLSFSHEINSKISNFNRENGVDDKVREMKNYQMLLEIYNGILQKTKPTKTVNFQTVGNERKQVTVEYKPTLTGAEVKEKQSSLKKQYRSLQNEIEKLNTREIELSFSFDDLENI